MDVFSFGIFLLMFNLVSGDKCTFHGPCSCNTPDYKIDLSPMMKHNKRPLTVEYLGAIYYLDPCGKALSVPGCKSLGADASGCQQEGDSAYGIAMTTGYTASGDPEAGTVTFTYHYGSGGRRRTAKMKLKCSHHERQFTYEGEHPIMNYNFLLSTKYACRHIPSDSHSGGLSTGSILLIVFFVLLIVYFIAGILFLKYHRKAEGIEIVPNRLFWMELPLLMKDGFVFVIAKVRGDSTYEKI